MTSPGSDRSCRSDVVAGSVTQRLVTAGDVDLAVTDRGAGEPVVFIQTALTADELVPLAEQPALHDGYRRIVYHRPGYGRSGPARGPASIPREAAQCRALLGALGVARAHIVGVSFSAAIGLQLAADAPDLVHSLTVAEPPPVHIPGADGFRAANERLLELRRERGVDAALEEFLTMLVGVDWRAEVDGRLPGAVEQIERDAASFFDRDVPALLDWGFGPAAAARITCPVLNLGGSDSGPWFVDVRALVAGWIPHAETEVIEGAGHSLEVTHPAEVAAALVGFLHRHPL